MKKWLKSAKCSKNASEGKNQCFLFGMRPYKPVLVISFQLFVLSSQQPQINREEDCKKTPYDLLSRRETPSDQRRSSCDYIYKIKSIRWSGNGRQWSEDFNVNIISEFISDNFWKPFPHRLAHIRQKEEMVMKKSKPHKLCGLDSLCRDYWTRTSDLAPPRRVRYQLR